MRTSVIAIIGSLLTLGVVLFLLNGCAFRTFYVHQGPPPLKAELKSPPPHPKAVWIPGHWRWEGPHHTYIWMPGYWETKPKGNVWAPGHWKHTPRGWFWVKGYWK